MSVRALCLLVLLLTAPSMAYLAPSMLLQRTRVGDQLEEATRRSAREWVEALPLTLTPAEFELRLAAGFPELAPTAAFQLYAGVVYVERRERLISAFEERIELLLRARDALEDYLYRVNRRLRRAPSGGAAVQVPHRDDFPPDLRQDETTLHVLRDLPFPTAGMPRRELRTYRDVATLDLAAVKSRLEQARQAEQAYVDNQVVWLRYLDARVQLLQGLPQEELLEVRKEDPSGRSGEPVQTG